LPYNIKIKININATTMKFVIKGINTTITNEDARKHIEQENTNIKIISLERICSKNMTPTTVIAITIPGNVMPKEIYYKGVLRRTEVFLPPIIQCSRCQSFFHSKKNCKKEVRCRYCSGAHTFEMCPKAKLDSNYKAPNNDRRCANCGGNHSSRYLGCPEYQKSKNILKESLENNIAIREIKKAQCYKTNKCNFDQGMNVKKSSDLTKNVLPISESYDEKESATEQQNIIHNKDILAEIKSIFSQIQTCFNDISKMTKRNEDFLRQIRKEKLARPIRPFKYQTDKNTNNLKSVVKKHMQNITPITMKDKFRQKGVFGQQRPSFGSYKNHYRGSNNLEESTIKNNASNNSLENNTHSNTPNLLLKIKGAFVADETCQETRLQNSVLVLDKDVDIKLYDETRKK
jgi:hypothetical protein